MQASSSRSSLPIAVDQNRKTPPERLRPVITTGLFFRTFTSRASLLAPSDPNLIVNIAIAEMRTERFGPERDQWRKAAATLEEALRLDPGNWRTRYFRALVLRGDGKLPEAADELRQVVARYPREPRKRAKKSVAA